MSLPKNFCLSFASADLTPASLTTFANHYEVLQLDQWATTEEIKAQFRKLRAGYFSTDVAKYRELQTAYSVLVDWDARREYDALYRVKMGLPPLTVDSRASSTSNGSVTDHSRSSSAGSVSLVKAAVSRIDAQSASSEGKKQRAEVTRLEEQQCQRDADPNWGLKHHFSSQYKSMLGTEPYHSYVPIAERYVHGGKKSMPQSPKYVGKIATKAVP